SYDGDGMDGSITTNVMALEIPVNAVYYIPTSGSGSVFLGAGPYAAYSLSGKVKAKGNVGDLIGGESEYDLDFGGDDRDQNAFDFRLNFVDGYGLSVGYTINAAYGLGLGNLSTSDNSDNKFAKRVLSFGVGFHL